MAGKVKTVVQLVFLSVFILLMGLGKIQLWMFIFLGSSLLTLLLGRFYCGWICPINTITRSVDWVYKKLNISRRGVPGWIKSPIFRYGVLLIFIGVLIFTLRTGVKLPVLPVLTIIGVVLTLVFVPALWHKYLCPYGTVLNIPARFAKYRYKVYEDDCIKCGICKKVCPGEAVEMVNDNVFPRINKGLCLTCNICSKNCPKNTIKYC